MPTFGVALVVVVLTGAVVAVWVVSMRLVTDNLLQGKTVTSGFTWEVQ